MSSCYEEYHTPHFSDRYDQLELRLWYLARKYPDTFQNHADVKFFARIRKAMDTCLTQPEHESYQLGNTLAKQKYKGKPLGKGYSHWRRIKKDMPDRYRIFFQFSCEDKEVIFAWLNDRCSLRREGSLADVYAVFAKLLAKGDIPNFYEEIKGIAAQKS